MQMEAAEKIEAEEEPHIIRRVRGNWLTRRPNRNAAFVALLSTLLLSLGSFFFWGDILGASSWMTGIPERVFSGHEYWRLWTGLIAHADLGHLLSNSVLFLAFAYLLYGHFGSWVFPGAALALGGLTNLVVLATMPSGASLLGISGVVYWMGGAWLALYFHLETRDKLAVRMLKAMGVGVVLFIPETILPEVSYLSHFVGFLNGLLFGTLYFRWNRQRFRRAEVVETIIEEPVEFDYKTVTIEE